MSRILEQILANENMEKAKRHVCAKKEYMVWTVSP